jgi:type I restriction enzyme S subunit
MISKINPSTSLPSEWKLVKLKEVCKTSSGGTPSRKNEQYFNGDIPWLKSGELNYNIVRYSEEKITKEAIENSSAKIFPKGTLLVALYGATVGRLGVLGIDAATNQAISAIFTHKLLFQKHLYWFLFSYRKKLLKDRIGGAQPNISQTILNDISLPFPPLNEQHQIVAKIEELFSELDNGIENLKKAREQLKTYRQAVLKYAFEGKLTKEWRNVNNVYNNNYLPQLKFKINKFNENKSGQDLPRRLPPIDLKKLKPLPFGWVWIEAHKICQSVRDGTHDTPKYVKTGMPLITSKNLKNGKIDFSNIQFISEEDHIEINKRSSVESGDILFGMIGTIGNPVIISSNNNFSIKNVGLFKKNPKLILSKYLKYWLDSSTLLKMLEDLQLIRGTTQKFISLGSLRVLPIPYSFIEEQYAIVQEIESRLSVCDKIEQTIEDSLEKAEALRQSILKKAFAGELTRDWREKHPELITGENSAEKLLEKIKAEKVLSIAGRKKPRSKKAKKK